MIGGRGVGAGGPVADCMERRRGADELQDLCTDPVHVDGKRHTAEADQSQPEFFLSHPRPSPGFADLSRELPMQAPDRD